MVFSLQTMGITAVISAVLTTIVVIALGKWGHSGPGAFSLWLGLIIIGGFVFLGSSTYFCVKICERPPSQQTVRPVGPRIPLQAFSRRVREEEVIIS